MQHAKFSHAINLLEREINRLEANISPVSMSYTRGKKNVSRLGIAYEGELNKARKKECEEAIILLLNKEPTQ